MKPEIFIGKFFDTNLSLSLSLFFKKIISGIERYGNTIVLRVLLLVRYFKINERQKGGESMRPGMSILRNEMLRACQWCTNDDN